MHSSMYNYLRMLSASLGDYYCYVMDYSVTKGLSSLSPKDYG